MLDCSVITRGVPTFRYGSNPRLFVVAEAPGKDEDELGEPMVGSAGQILWKMLRSVGITSAYVGNTIRCKPEDNRDPTQEEMNVCGNHTLDEIRRLKPKIVMFAGKVPANWFFKTKNKPLKQLRGWHRLSIGAAKYVDAYVTNHPSALHYNADIEPIFRSDLETVKRRLDGVKELTKLQFKKRYLDTLPKLRRAVDNTLHQPRSIFFDFEGWNLNKIDSTQFDLSWGWIKDGMFYAYSVPLEHPKTPWSASDYKTVKQLLRRMFQHKGEGGQATRVKRWVAHNAKHEILVLMDMLGHGLDKPNFRITNAPVHCTLQRAHAVDENRGSGRGGYSLEALASHWVGVSPDVWDDDVSDALYNVDQDGNNYGKKIELLKLCDHSSKDIVVTELVERKIQSKAKGEAYNLATISPLLQNIPYLLASLERNGVPLSVQRLSSLKSDKGPIRKRKLEIEQTVNSLHSAQKAISEVRGNVTALFAKAGKRSFPINKRAYQLALFFDILGLEPIEYGKTVTDHWPNGEPSVNKEFFATYKEQKECKLIEEWRQLNKLETGYIDSWWDYVSASPDSRVRGDFRGAGTNTGRLSSGNPNWQQIPAGRNEAAKKVKSCLMPLSSDRNLRVIVAADFSQAEVRWLAQISEEPVLTDMFEHRSEMLMKYARLPSQKIMDTIKSKCDLHTSTAAEIFGLSLREVTPEKRQGAKATCVVGSTLIPTSRGLIPIRDGKPTSVPVRDSDGWAYPTREVLASRASQLDEADTWFKRKVPTTYKVIAENGSEIRGTPEHPLLVLTPNLRLEERRLDQIRPGDYLVITKGHDLWSSCKVPVPDLESIRIPSDISESTTKRLLSEGYSSMTVWPDKWPDHVNDDLGSLMGYLVSEGYGTKSFSNSDSILQDLIRSELHRVFGNNVWGENEREDGLVIFRFPAWLSRLFTSLGVDPDAVSKEKSIPHTVLQSPKSVVVRFVRSLFNGDGDTTDGKIRYSSASKKLIKQLQILLLNLGVYSSFEKEIRVTPVGKERRVYWRLYISGSSNVSRFMEIVGSDRLKPVLRDSTTKSYVYDSIPYLKAHLEYLLGRYTEVDGRKARTSISAPFVPVSMWENNRAEDPESSWDEIRTSDYDFVPVASVKKIESPVWVYDWRVTKSHWFVANGIVSHNTFGLIYGQSEFGLSANLGIDIEEAKELRESWLGRFVKANEWFHYTESFAVKHGWVESPIKRRRHLPALLLLGGNSYNKAVGHAKRVARNAPIQSIASDTNLWLAIKIQQYIDRYRKPWKLLALIHDSVIAEVPLEDSLEYVKLVRSLAHDEDLLQEFGVRIKVPMELDVELGYSYGETIKLTPSMTENERVVEQLYDTWKTKGIEQIIMGQV